MLNIIFLVKNEFLILFTSNYAKYTFLFVDNFIMHSYIQEI